MKIGIFGGSFDPIHYGHLIMAEQCRVLGGLDQVWFVPTARQPLKPDGPVAGNKHRLEMLKLAIAGHSSFHVSSEEIDRGDVSFTVQTLTEFDRAHPDAEFFFIMGTDALASFERWKDPKEICRLSVPLVVRRRGSHADYDLLKPFMDEKRYEYAEKCQIESPLIEISSTDLRQCIATGKSIRYQLPRAVEKFIEHSKLYVSE